MKIDEIEVYNMRILIAEDEVELAGALKTGAVPAVVTGLSGVHKCVTGRRRWSGSGARHMT